VEKRLRRSPITNLRDGFKINYPSGLIVDQHHRHNRHFVVQDRFKMFKVHVTLGSNFDNPTFMRLHGVQNCVMLGRRARSYARRTTGAVNCEVVGFRSAASEHNSVRVETK
jgi:hypothetical protein